MHFHLVQRTSKTLPDAGLVASVSVRPESNMHMSFFAKKLVHWKSKGVLLGIGIRRIAHEKAPCFKAYCWRKNVKRVLPTKNDYTAYKNT